MIFYNVTKQSDFENRILFRYTNAGKFLFAFVFHAQLSSSKPLKSKWNSKLDFAKQVKIICFN